MPYVNRLIYPSKSGLRPLIESEHDVLTKLLSSNSEDQTGWKWDSELCRLVRGSDVD